MRQVLAIPAFRRLWLAQFVSMLGDFLAAFAILNVASFQLHASASQMTWISIAYLAPTALLGPVIGVFVDRWPLKPTLIASDLIRSCVALTYLAATQIWHYYAATLAIAFVSTFFSPAQGVGVRITVPKEGLLSASALMQQIIFIMRIAGPGLSGLIISAFGPQVCYWVDSGTFMLSAVLLWSIPLVRPAPGPDAQAQTATGLKRVWVDLRAGVEFILHHGAVLFVVLAMASAIFAIGCFGPLIAVHVRDNLHASTGVFSSASALIGGGIFVGMTFLRKLAARF